MVPFSFAGRDIRRRGRRRALLAGAGGAAGRRPAPRESELVRAARAVPAALRFARDADGAGREVERTGATRLYCLGDSFHDRFGCDRLPGAARELLLHDDRRARLGVDRRQPRPGLCGSLRRPARRRGRGRRDRPSPRSGSRRPAARDVGPLSTPSSGCTSRPPRLAPLLRRVGDQADPAGVRVADRRPRRHPSRDHEAGRRRRRGAGARCRTGCCASRSPPDYSVRLDLDRHRAGRRQQQPRDRRRRLRPKVAAWSSLRAAWRSKSKPRASAELLQPVEMLVDVGNPLVGVETHRFVKIGGLSGSHRGP